MIAYLDTSALVKLVVDEPGSDLAIEVWNGVDTRVTSVIAYAEGRAAIAAARRGARLTVRSASRARGRLDDIWSQLARIDVSETTARAAGDLAEREDLRGFDAVHLATALEAGAGGDLLFVTWDAVLARAALRLGASVAPAVEAV